MFEALNRVVFTQDWITIILLIVLVLISLLKINFSERFSKLFTLFYSDKYYTDYIKTKPFLLNTFHFIAFIIIFFNISLWVYYSIQAFLPHIFLPNALFYFQILVVVLIYFILRYTIGLFFANIFELEGSQKYFTFLKISNLTLIMIVSYPFLIMFNYTTIALYKYWLIFGLVLILFLLFFRYFLMFKNERLKFNNYFYIILYLCALEIAPFIVIYKVFVD